MGKTCSGVRRLNKLLNNRLFENKGRFQNASISHILRLALFICTILICLIGMISEDSNAQPSLSSPSDRSIYNGNNTTSVTFSWSTVSGALEYWLNVFPEGSSANPKYNATTGTATSKSLTDISTWSSGVYIWQVRVRTSAGWSSYSTTRQFIVDRPPGTPTLSSPAAGSSFNIDASTSFSWSAPSSGMARYTFRVVSGTDLNQNQIRHIEQSGTSKSETFDDASYNPGTHTWGVRAIKSTPSGYNQTTYEQTIGWGGYATRTFVLNTVPPDLVAERTFLYSLSGNEVTNPKVGDQVRIYHTWRLDTEMVKSFQTSIRIL